MLIRGAFSRNLISSQFWDSISEFWPTPNADFIRSKGDQNFTQKTAFDLVSVVQLLPKNVNFKMLIEAGALHFNLKVFRKRHSHSLFKLIGRSFVISHFCKKYFFTRGGWLKMKKVTYVRSIFLQYLPSVRRPAKGWCYKTYFPAK